MEKSELIKLLQQGKVDEFNRYREEHHTWIDLSGANLTGANLTGANLTDANLTDAKLTGADLSSTDLSGANLSGTDLSGADLTDAYLSRPYLSGTDLSGAYLSGAYLFRPYLSGADLTNSTLSNTVFANVDLSTVKGLESVQHIGPSHIDSHTLTNSRGQIPEPFLKGCGMSDWEIEAAKLNRLDISSGEITDILYKIHDLRVGQAIQINPLFISYSHTDGAFVDTIEPLLNDSGIRFWRDTHDATAGRLERQIDRAIRLNPTLLVILSQHSVKSDWVEHEVRLARKLEIETGRDVLCPIALDDSWKTCRWPERLREQIMEYNILDFSAWQMEKTLQQMYNKLVDGLDVFYKA